MKRQLHKYIITALDDEDSVDIEKLDILQRHTRKEIAL
jgi:hypothetical protein